MRKRSGKLELPSACALGHRATHQLKCAQPCSVRGAVMRAVEKKYSHAAKNRAHAHLSTQLSSTVNSRQHPSKWHLSSQCITATYRSVCTTAKRVHKGRPLVASPSSLHTTLRDDLALMKTEQGMHSIARRSSKHVSKNMKSSAWLAVCESDSLSDCCTSSYAIIASTSSLDSLVIPHTNYIIATQDILL